MKSARSSQKKWRQYLGAGAAMLVMLAVLSAASWWATRAPGAIDAETVVVYKSPTCHCCSKWVEHLRVAGFTVSVKNENAMNPLKTRLGVPADLASCHTALVHGYLIEGHVPAEDIRRLLAERPKAKGLAVPGMPIGSPGMEQGDRVDRYEVVLFSDDAPASVFATHGPAAP
ncbi:MULTISPECIES: DUF411 domain-containing protein [Hydrocarboniphaga]|jgi:hypothetical protein|nr:MULTISPECIES: DUF411 domain-containing protein [Hydrocarboniphaga]MDZ4079779.1 DUF411 domain-containing protein [Hydrocarboniphaga sp.]